MADEAPRMDVAQLVAEYHQAVYRYAYRLSGSVPDAEDLTQQVFLIVQQKMGQLRRAESAQGWLFAILRNCFLKGCEQRRPIPATNLQLDVEMLPAEIPREREIDRDRLQEAIDQLPAAFRVVLVMFYFEECSYRQIAEQLDLPMGTVMSRLARAKRHLRSRLFAPRHTAARKRQPTPAV
jgi:RNA polymerase sigma-70 factor (ECF subfamily)